MPKPQFYTNAKQEQVMTYRVFQSMRLESVWEFLTRKKPKKRKPRPKK